MEDENWIELSLGLSCGGPSSKFEVNKVSSDPKAEKENGNKIVGGNMNVSDVSSKHFFRTGLENANCNGQQKSDLLSWEHENFWTDLRKCSAPVSDDSKNLHANVSQFTRHQDLWVSSNKTTYTEEEKSGLSKRKLPFDDIDFERKHDTLVGYADTHGKGPSGSKKSSLVSLTAQDVSSGENEGVVESQADNSASWLVSQCEDNARRSDTSKFINKHFLPDPSRIGSEGQKHPCVSGNISNLELGKLAHGIPGPLNSVAVTTVPNPVPANVPPASCAPIASGSPSPYVTQLMPLANSECPMVQRTNASNLQLAFGYLSAHFPMLESDSSMVFGSQPQHISSLPNRDQARVQNSEYSDDDVKISHNVVQAPRTSPVALPHEIKSVDWGQDRGKYVEVSTSNRSSQKEDDKEGNIPRLKDTANQLAGESSEGSAIRPGLAPDLKFGGCGSYPDLPWVSTTGPGPNGRTISGVTYKYNKSQIKIVCACHGFHMSPEEFIQHASADAPSESNTGSKQRVASPQS